MGILYTVDDIYNIIYKFMYGGKYDFARKNNICMHLSFENVGFTQSALDNMIADLHAELKLPEHIKLIGCLNTTLRHFIRQNLLIINQN